MRLLAKLLELLIDLIGRAAGIVNDELGFLFRLLRCLFALELDLVVILLRLLFLLFGLQTQMLRLGARPFHLLTLLFELIENILKVRVVLVDHASGLVDDVLRKAEAAGDRKGVGLSGDADEQPVGRLERFHVELTRGIDDALGAHGVYFQLCVMRRRGDLRAALPAELDQRDCQRRALGRVGARAELVQQDERFPVADADDLDDIFHMRREGGERLLDRLLIADVRQHQREHGNKAPVIGGDMQTAFRHQRQKADGLERDGFAARIGAGDDERIEVRSEPDGDRHDRLLVDQRMAGAL